MATPLSASAALAAFKAEGISVQEYKSWRTHNRNHKGAWGPMHGVMIHHTVSSADAASVALCYNGHSSLPGPLCHGVGRTDGVLALVGWGRANHAGLGDDDVLRAVIAEGKLPSDNEANTDGNARFYGLEIVNQGNNRDVYQWEQYECAVKFAVALCRKHGWNERSCIGHKEWQPGKIDPRGPVEGEGSFTMSMFRADVKAALAQPAGKWRLHATKLAPTPVPTPPKPAPTTIVPKSRESEATVTAQAKKALADWPFIRAVETKHGLPTGLLLAVGSRETNLRNVVGDGGHGHGVWQQDDRWWTPPAGFDQDVQAQAEKAAKLLADNIKAVGLAPGVAAYNAGLTGVRNALAAGKSADSATTGGDYAADVLGRAVYTAAVVKLAPQRPTEWVEVTGFLPVIRKGDTGWYVGWAQRNLNRLVDPNVAITGVYDDATAVAVKRFYAEELAYDATGRELADGGWRRLLSMAKDAEGNML